LIAEPSPVLGAPNLTRQQQGARLVVLGAFELRGIPGQLVVPDLPSEFPSLRLATLPPSATDHGE
jgi:hypothetical protein